MEIKSKWQVIGAIEVANDQQVAILKRGVEAWNKWREQHPKVAIDLFGIDLTGIDLHGANLSGADLSGEELRGANLQGADLSGANLQGSDLFGANLSKANLSITDLSGTDLILANLSSACVIRANFTNADLSQTDCTDADFSYSRFSKALLSMTDFTGANLTQAKLPKANLIGAIFCRTNLTQANFLEAKLLEADFDEANLKNASFYMARIERTNFKSSNLNGAFLVRTEAIETNFSNAELTGACIHGWNIDKYTNFNNLRCKYIFRDVEIPVDDQEAEYLDRVPATGEFAPGDFQKLFQKAINTVDLIFQHGIDWKAFSESFIKLQSETGEELAIAAIETRDDGSFVIRINAPVDAQKAEIEKFIYSKYKAALKEQTEKYKAMLADKDKEISNKEEIIQLYREKSTDLKQIVFKLAESQPVFNNTNTNIGRDQNTNATNSIVAGHDISGEVEIQNQE
ncbi:pentapeptide repeat protein [Thalassoporum mexicanum PCC 7367]|uniref:pentapeptide repeat-containing protein n=1 Tax=Thalassoporum mexicanum TaxID=3457544 RepID=UPI00029FFE0F|nr:pentapeptide repeat-containing protein [Pseudanabaena sp. PCC 7367]AFY68889.1 pentapeptide repeat protein [Pseudanabaena sp. PCC 7367]